MVFIKIKRERRDMLIIWLLSKSLVNKLIKRWLSRGNRERLTKKNHVLIRKMNILTIGRIYRLMLLVLILIKNEVH